MPAAQTAPPAGVPTRTARLPSVGWALLPLLLGIPAAPCFAWAAYRLRSRAVAAEAAAYAVLTVAFFGLATDPHLGGPAGAIGIGLMALATTRAFVLRRKVFQLDGTAATANLAPPVSTTPVVWHPPRETAALKTRDPEQPATWTMPFDCTGNDQHLLSLPWQRTAVVAAGGAALTALAAWAHVYGRGFGAGIGMMTAPLLTALFSRRVDGATLYYRNWGVQHSLRLDRVTRVTSKLGPHQAIYLRLATPDLPKPVSVTIRAAGWVAPPAARDHLLGWLDHPGVQLSPEANELLRSGTLGGIGVRLRRRHRRAWFAAWLLLPLLTVGLLGWRVYDNHRIEAALAIPDAPGYDTMTGPHGKPLAIGRPWGDACEPLRIAAEQQMPGDVYTQLTQVVDEARLIGLNVTLEDRAYRWYPSTLRIPAGMDPGSVPLVVIGTTTAPAPTLASGRPQRIAEGWYARSDPDGHHEDLTAADGRLYLATLAGNPMAQRTALRELVAFAGGIGRTHNTGSGIRAGATADRFTAADTRALQVMSGCG